ncbi:MAG: hypothetical protein ACI9W6_002606, partial [Motiliproteus sp.]
EDNPDFSIADGHNISCRGDPAIDHPLMRQN